MTTTILDSGSASAGVTLSGGALIATFSGTAGDQGAQVAAADARSSGKFYFEAKWSAADIGGDSGLGICKVGSVSYTAMGANAANAAVLFRSSNLWVNTANLGAVMAAIATNDLLAWAVDLDGLQVWVKNLTQGTAWNNNVLADPARGIGGKPIPAGSYVPIVLFTGGTTGQRTMNFGGSTFTGTAPDHFQQGWPTAGTNLTVADSTAGGHGSGGRTNNSTIVTGSGSGLTPVFLTDDGTKRTTMLAGFSINQFSSGGTFAPTEAPDVATFIGNTGIAGPFNPTEHADTFASVFANSATMGATEHQDTWATSSGFNRFGVEGFTDTPDSGGFTTLGPDRILVRIQYGVSVVGPPSRVATVTDTNGNVWQGESYVEAGQDTHNDNVRIEIWWAYCHNQVTAMPTSITIFPGGSSTTSSQFGFAIKGMNGNFNYPFDSANSPYSYGGAVGGFGSSDGPVQSFVPYSDGPMEAASGVSPTFVSGNSTGVTISGSPALVLTSSGSGNPNNYASLDPSLALVGGRYYFEVTFNNINGTDYGAGFGYLPLLTSSLLSAGVGGFIVRGTGHIFNGADVATLGVTPANGDVIGIYLDLDNGLGYAKDITQSGNWNGDATANPLRNFGGINIAPSSDSLVHAGLIGQSTAPAVIFGAPAGNSSAQMTFNFAPTPPLGARIINGGFTSAVNFPYPALNIIAMASATGSGSGFGILPTIAGFATDLLDAGGGSQRNMSSSLQHRFLSSNIRIEDKQFFSDAGTVPSWMMLYDTIVPGAPDPGSLQSTEAPDVLNFRGYPGAFGFLGDLFVIDGQDIAAIVGFERDSGVLSAQEDQDIFGASGKLPLVAVMAATEATDIFAAVGLGLGENGTFVTTEGVDILTISGNTPITAFFSATENADRAVFIGAGVTQTNRRRQLIVT
jgi:hypothetical protein